MKDRRPAPATHVRQTGSLCNARRDDWGRVARPPWCWLGRCTAQGVITRTIPSSGESLPVLGLGTWQTFDVGRVERERAPLEAVLRSFFAAGRLIDASPMYGRAERVVGDLTSKLGMNSELFIATKVWTSGRERGIAEMNASMQKLGRERIDLMQVHNLVDAITHLQTLAAWKAEGIVRYTGITHYTASAHDAVIELMRETRPDFVQINYSLAEPEAERRLLPLARELGIAVIVNRPFASGSLTRAVERSRPLPPVARELGCTTWSQLLLKWIVAHQGVTCVIPATANVEHMNENIEACDEPLPDESQRRAIAAAVV